MTDATTRKGSGTTDTRKVIITCAVTGAIHTPTMSPYLPITPDQIASEAIAAAEAGAAIVPPMVTHYHGPATIADMNRHLLGKALGRMGIDLPGMRRWGEGD